MPELDLGGGFGIAYTTEHTPLTPRELGEQMADLVGRELKAVGDGGPGTPTPRISIEPGRAIAGPSTFTLYEVGTVKDVDLGGGVQRAYVSVDGGMSDNIRTALYDADYSCTLASRARTPRRGWPAWSGKHCESGDIVVMDEYLPEDIAAGDLLAVPGTGAYCRSMSSQYNHTPAPAGGRRPRRAGAGPGPPRDGGGPAGAGRRLTQDWRGCAVGTRSSG